MKIGLFFGTFNPIHIGHLIIANHILEYSDLDRIWFVVSPQNPLKDQKSLLSEKHRLQMVRLAIDDNYKFKASNIEFKLPKPSYTITTLTYLQEKYPLQQFVLIMGSDNLETLNKWKNYEQILKHYSIYVYKRKNGEGDAFKSHPNVKIFDFPYLNISASYIRKALEEGKSAKYLIPEKALEYIQTINFYKI